MKSLYITSAFILTMLSNVSSQYIGDVPLQDIPSEYIELTTGSNMLRKGVVAYIDYGQESVLYTNKDHLLIDNNGKQIEFRSNIDALNYMFREGYELAEIYVIPSETSGSAYFVLRKKK